MRGTGSPHAWQCSNGPEDSDLSDEEEDLLDLLGFSEYFCPEEEEGEKGGRGGRVFRTYRND